LNSEHFSVAASSLSVLRKADVDNRRNYRWRPPTTVAGSVPLVIVTIESPARADNTPTQVLLTPDGVAITNPLGKLSAKLVIAAAVAFPGRRGIPRTNDIVERDHARRGVRQPGLRDMRLVRKYPLFHRVVVFAHSPLAV